MKLEQIQKVLAGIQASVPKSLKDNAVREVDASPTVKMVMEKAMTDDLVNPELRERIKVLWDAGEFSKKKTVENPKIVKMIDQYISREINKAIKEKRLPPRSKLKQFLPKTNE